MNSLRKSTQRALLALFPLTLLTGCLTSGEPSTVAVRPLLPDLPPRVVAGCPDILLGGDALKSLITHRVALAACRSLQKETVSLYNGLGSGLSNDLHE